MSKSNSKLYLSTWHHIKMWTNNVIIEFLNLYEKERCIWDPRDENHKIQNVVTNAWDRIALSLSVPFSVIEIKKKKDSLMATYRKLNRKVKKSKRTSRTESGYEHVYQPDWFAYSQMNKFLHSIYLVKSTTSPEVDTRNVAQLEASTSQNADTNEDSNETPLEAITNSKLPNLKNWTSPSLNRPVKLVTGKRKRIPGSMNKIQRRNQNRVYEEKLNLIQMEKKMTMMQFEWERVEHELRVEALKLDVEIKKKSLDILK
ncbi:uncharacterized protein LOC132941794 isoform X2 [Metopolophium dirhodum]|uniref:uncharacterized protein LOC132941794 isoform X2 n=1 Tax=Metopolophium dirhodum TaxID=44670 RepID=UPI002990401F|nr:uncharacterized protein LOC132941794 isoform X2 [Metopolophium dirhodum]